MTIKDMFNDYLKTTNYVGQKIAVDNHIVLKYWHTLVGLFICVGIWVVSFYIDSLCLNGIAIIVGSFFFVLAVRGTMLKLQKRKKNDTM